jgi:outer membrane receptor protein involved in Fe transport
MAVTVQAQTINGSISGTVTDQNDAAVPGATVTVKNVATGQTRDDVTNDDGQFRVSALPVGVYTVKAEKTGYAVGTNESVQVSPGVNTDANFKLGAGGVSASVDVSDTGALLETTQSQVSKTVDQQRIMELPGRNSLTGLALLNPGVLPNQNSRPGSGFVVNGNRSRSNNFTIDGANNNDQSLSIPRQNLPPEAIGEFQIITNTFAAEYGRNSGSYVNQITRSGTNDFHGTGFYTWGGNGLDSLTTSQQRTFNSNKAAGLSDYDALHRARNVSVDNIYGGTLGGPIKRNHTFFFTSADFEDFRTTISAVSRAALDASSRATLLANRNNFASPAAVDFILNNFPASNDPTLPGGSLAGSQVVARNAAGNPVTGSTATSTLTFRTFNRTLSQGLPYGNDFGRFLGKINTKINDKDQLSFRLLYDKATDPGSPASLPGLEIGQNTKNHSFTINDVYLLSSKLINESRFTYSRREISFPENLDAFANGAQLSISGSLSAFNGGNANFPQSRLDNVFEWTENVGYSTGNHAFKVGYNGLRYKLNSFFAPNSKGFVSYSSLNNLLNDVSNLIQKANGDFNTNAITYEHSFFAQDDWRATPSLTLNLGLRYEYVTTPFGFFSNAKPDINNFGPRVGMAWNPKDFLDGKFVMRAGFGIAYDQVFQNILLNNSRNYPRAITNSITCTGCQAFNGVSAIAVPAAQTLLNTSPSNYTGNINLLDYRFFAPNERVKSPMSKQWTVSFQYQIGQDYVAKAEYIGTQGSNLVREVESNYGFSTASGLGNGQRLDPTRGSVLVGQGIAKSIYHSMQLTFEKRFSAINLFGLNFGSSTFNANYTWSSFISEADDVLGGQANRTIPADPRCPSCDRARSGFDQPHRFVMSSVWVSPEVFRGNGFLNRVFSGWELATVTTLADGTPFSVLAATNELGILAGQVSTINLSQRVGLQNPSRNDNSFTIATVTGGVLTIPDPTARYVLFPDNAGRAGSLGANTERTGGTKNTNLSVVKNIRTFGESQRLQLRAEIFNLFNHRNFTTIPTNTLSATTTSASFLNLGLTNVAGRGFLFGARYFF